MPKFEFSKKPYEKDKLPKAVGAVLLFSFDICTAVKNLHPFTKRFSGCPYTVYNKQYQAAQALFTSVKEKATDEETQANAPTILQIVL